jgi:hypothetical protein
LLRFHHGQGDVASYDFSLAGRGLRDGKPITFFEKVKCRVAFQAESEGTQQVEVRFLSGTFDATSGDRHKSGAVTPMVTTRRISPTGEVTACEVISGEAVTVPFGEISFSPDDVGFVLDLPAGPVGVGSTWKADHRNPEEGRLPEAETITYTLLGEASFKGRPCAKIKAVSLTEFTGDTRASADEPAVRIRASIGDMTVFLFDYERGLVMSAESTQDLSFTTTVDDPGKGPVVKKDSLTFTGRSVLTGFVPRKAG